MYGGSSTRDTPGVSRVDGLMTAAECADHICRPLYPDGIPETKFASMVEARSTETEIFEGNLVQGMRWKGALCLGIEL